MYPLRVYVCESCLLVQLEEFESPEQIFTDYAYFSSFSESWLQHARAYVESAVERFRLNERSQVVEIASNDGYLLQYFAAKGIPALGIEPAANVAAAAVQKGIPTIIAFFSEAQAQELAAQGIRADLIVGNNVLAHVPKLNDFVRGLKVLLKPRGTITLEFPHVMRLIAEIQFDTIYHEHFSYFSLVAVERVFLRQELRIFDVEELPTHGGSLRISVCHGEESERAPSQRVAELRAREEAFGLTRPETYRAFAEKVRKTKQKLVDFLVSKQREGKVVVGYGAPAKGNTLLNYCGIGLHLLRFTVDRSPHKQGLFLPGTRIPICHPDKIRETTPDYLLILPWNLKEEIMEQMAHVRAWGGQFVLAIPEVRVYS
jgi:2-polyprenyl-3-methyl-5-hydroxy-6-metoxy-1,4-benzoquinol methylase